MNKVELVEAVIAQVEQTLQRAIDSQRFARTEAAAHGGAMISRYDTFKEEAEYLAAAQGNRIRELETGLRRLREFRDRSGYLRSDQDRILPGTLVLLREASGAERRYVLLPYGGGHHVSIAGVAVAVLNTGSPLGSALIGKEDGDEVSVSTKQGPLSAEIVQVS